MIDIWGQMQEDDLQRNMKPKQRVATPDEIARLSAYERRVHEEFVKILNAETTVKGVMLKALMDIVQNVSWVRSSNPVVTPKKIPVPGSNYPFDLKNVVWEVRLDWGSIYAGEERMAIITRIGSAGEESTNPLDINNYLAKNEARRQVVVYGGDKDNEFYATEIGRHYYIGSNDLVDQDRYGNRSAPRGFDMFPDGWMNQPQSPGKLTLKPFASIMGNFLRIGLDKPQRYSNPYTQEQLDEFRRKQEYVHEELARQAAFVSDNSHETGCS